MVSVIAGDAGRMPAVDERDMVLPRDGAAPGLLSCGIVMPGMPGIPRIGFIPGMLSRRAAWESGRMGIS